MHQKWRVHRSMGVVAGYCAHLIPFNRGDGSHFFTTWQAAMDFADFEHPSVWAQSGNQWHS